MQRMVRGRSSDIRPPLDTKRIEGGFYSALERGKQELQKRPDAPRPSRFVVLRAIDTLVVQVAAWLPAFFEEHVTELFDVLHDARAFACADVQPDARAGLDGCCVGKTVDDELVPPDGRRERGDFPKNARLLQPQQEENQAPQGRAADAVVLGAGESAVFAID